MHKTRVFRGTSFKIGSTSVPSECLGRLEEPGLLSERRCLRQRGNRCVYPKFGLGRKQGRRDAGANDSLRRSGSRWSICPGVDRIDADCPDHCRQQGASKTFSHCLVFPRQPTSPSLESGVSAGSGISQMVWQQIGNLIEAFLATGDPERFTKDFMAYGELQTLFANTK